MIANKSISVFTCYTNGNLVLNYGWLTGRLDQELIELLHNKITMIPTFKQIPSNFDKWPTIKITNAFSEAQYIAEFKKIVESLGSEIK